MFGALVVCLNFSLSQLKCINCKRNWRSSDISGLRKLMWVKCEVRLGDCVKQTRRLLFPSNVALSLWSERA